MRRASHEAKELHGANVDCKNCSMFALCLPVGVGDADLDLLERIIKRRKLIRRGEDLFRRGDRFHAVYAVKSGSIKTFTPADRKTVQVTGFHLPGELLGLDAVGAGVYQYSARALETASLCEVPFDKLEGLGAIVHGVQRQMLRIMSAQIRHDLAMHVLHCKRSAEASLAAFLVSLSARLGERGFSRSEFRLSMSRADIGNYLGLAKETVSRLFTQFQERQLISVKRKSLRVHDLYRLEALAGLHLAGA